MKKISYIKLYSYFQEEENLSKVETLRNMWRTRNLPKEFKEMIYFLVEGKTASIKNFQVEGISLSRLHKDEGMTWMQAIFFLDWLRREPANARVYVSSRRFRTPMIIDADTKDRISDALGHLKSETGIEPEYTTAPKDTSNEDIDVEDIKTDTCSDERTSGQDSKTINQS